MLRGLFTKLNSLIRGRKVDQELIDDLEEALILADVGIDTTERLLQDLRRAVKQSRVTTDEQVRDMLQEKVCAVLGGNAAELNLSDEGPTVWLILGVNGVGKTTTIGKLAAQQKSAGRRVLLVAADTFRAAAIEQLQEWAKRVDVPVIAHQQGADPAAVVFDAIQSAKARGIDLVIIDTAGRLHTKHNLMEELRKIHRVIERELNRSADETLLVIDASTGQNGLQQAVVFSGAVPLTGLVLTKLDGTAKGGIVLSVYERLQIPIKLVGVGERVEDLAPFDPAEFARALFE